MSRALAVLGGAALVAGAPGGARAETITEITLDKNGPNQNLPLRSSFYLKGSADGIDNLAIVFVRYSRGVWGIPGTSYNCSDIVDALPSPDAKSPLFTGQGADFRKVTDIWPTAQPAAVPPNTKLDARRASVFDEVRTDPVFVAGPWKRDDKTDKEFKVLVSNPRFFQAGARYCMLAYKRVKKDRSDDVKVILDDYGRKSLACADKPDEAAVRSCQQQSTNEAVAAIAKVFGDEDAAKQWAAGALAQAGDLAESAFKIRITARLLARWMKPDPASKPDELAAVSEGTLARVIARALEREFKLRGTASGGVVRFFNDTGTIEAKYLGILGNYAGVRIAQDLGDPRTQASIQVDFDKILVPDTKISLRDVVALRAHQLKYGADWVLADDLFTTKVAPALGRAVKDAKEREVLATFADKIGAWNDLLRAIQSDSMLGKDLRTWLLGTEANRYMDGAALRGCTDPALAPLGDVKCAGTPPAAGSLFGFANKEVTPFAALSTALRDQIRAQEALVEIMKSAASVGVLPFTTGALPLHVDLTQKDFVTTYLMPTVGSARFLSTKEAFSTPYVGVQVFLFPNPIDEPMWTNGVDDLGRLFAVEVGMAAQTGSFGPGNRYSGAGGVPPVFAGLALHPLPYVTMSFGRSLLNVRSGPLPQETPTMIGSWYWGLSVQANIPDLIRSISSGGTNSTAIQTSKEK